MPTIIALIPARAGSKRVAQKNIRLLGPHPLIAYTICAARTSGIFDDVVVSTDSSAIAEIAEYYGASVPFLRPQEFSGDLSPDIDWVSFTLKTLAASELHFDCFSILRPTSPFRTAETIVSAWTIFRESRGVDSLRAVEKCKQHPGKMWVLHGNRITPLLLNPKGTPWHSTPYQALPEVYVQNASLEMAWTRVVLNDGTIAGKSIVPFFPAGFEGFDLNDGMDWKIAEELIRTGQAKLPEISRPPFESTHE